jgi:HSP20 family protein
MKKEAKIMATTAEITPWRQSFTTPFRELERMRREMDQLWGSFLTEKPTRRSEAGVFGEWFPEFDLSETKDALVVKAEVPGMSPRDIHISLVDNSLVIKGEKKQQMDEKNENYHYIGRSYGEFARAIPLPREVEGDKVKASYKDGVLNIFLPKSAQAKEKEIQIKIEP